MTTLTPGEVGAALEAALAEEPRIAAASAYVFGSVAEGRAHRQSDAGHAFVRDVQLRAADLNPFLRRLRRVKLRALASS